MAFGVILIASVAGFLAAAGATLLGQSLLVTIAVYVAACLVSAGITMLVVIVKKVIAKRRAMDTGDAGFAVKSSD
ncbi:MAG: hypothetical protein AAGL23_09040 [Pseudomonadota bacterium]